MLYPRLMQRGQADTEYIARVLSQRSSFSKGAVAGLLQELADELAYQMGQGKMCIRDSYQIKRLHLDQTTRWKTRGKRCHPNRQHRFQDRI